MGKAKVREGREDRCGKYEEKERWGYIVRGGKEEGEEGKVREGKRRGKE